MWPIVRRFGLIALGIVALWLASVLALNLTINSPSGYVSSYLSALESGNYGLAARQVGLSEVPRVTPLPGQLNSAEIVSQAVLPNGEIVVEARYQLGGSEQSTLFVLKASEPVLFFFTTYEFAKPPLARLELTVVGDNRVSINATELAIARLGVPPSVSVLVPGIYDGSLETEWLSSEVTRVSAVELGSTNSMRVVIEPTPQLVDRTRDAIEDFLDDCVDQAVLQPMSCPFGITVTDRVLGAPQWTILDYPEVSLRLGADRVTWSVVASRGTAQVNVQVQSLFDGELDDTVETISFTMLGVVRGTTVDEPVLNLY
jgi:hypothetical protein